jgi:hypothetical protein
VVFRITAADGEHPAEVLSRWFRLLVANSGAPP